MGQPAGLSRTSPTQSGTLGNQINEGVSPHAVPCQVCVCVWCVCLLVCPVRVPACLSVCVHWGTSTCTLVAVRTEEVCVSLKGNGVCVLSRSYHLTMSLNTHTHTHNNGCRCPLPYLICTQTSQILMWFSDILNECCW